MKENNNNNNKDLSKFTFRPHLSTILANDIEPIIIVIGKINVSVSGLISNLTPVDIRMVEAYVRIANAPFRAWKKKVPMIRKKPRRHDLSLTEIMKLRWGNYTYVFYVYTCVR